MAISKKSYSLNVKSLPPSEAREYAGSIWDRPPEDMIPDFDKNYKALQAAVKRAPAIPRIQMPVIEPDDIGLFNKRLNEGYLDLFQPYVKGKLVGPVDLTREDGPWVELGVRDGDPTDDVVRAKITNIPVGKLKPTQDQIWLEKLVGNIGKWGVPKSGSPVLSTTVIVSSDGYILDGHHRYGQAMLADPSLKMRALLVPIPMKQLLEIGRDYGEAIGNKPKQASAIRVAYHYLISKGE